MQANKNLHLIQALRGIASLFVVLLHTTVNASDILHTDFLFKAFKFGGAGVDIFFVISGFIISFTTAVLPEVDKISLLIRRAMR